MHILFLTTEELTRDPRVRRAVDHARQGGHVCYGVCLGSGQPVPLEGIDVRRSGGAGLPAMMSARRRPRGWLLRELRGIARLARWAVRTGRLVRAAKAFPQVDVVHANDLETLPAGALLARTRRARLVYDAHEIAQDEDPTTPRLYRFVAGAIEGFAARRADAVITVSAPIADVLASTLSLDRRPYVVLNAPYRSPLADVAGDASRSVRAIYQGAVGPGRRSFDLLDAAETLTPETTLTIRLAGSEIGELRAEAARRGLTNEVAILDPVPPDVLVEALSEFDAGVIINRPVSRNDELVFPNKLFEYMMAGLAIVAPRLPGLTPLVEGERIGILYEPGNTAALGAAMNRLAEDRPALTEMRRRARQAAVERYNAEAQRPALYAAWGL